MRTFISTATCVALTACVTGPGPGALETGGSSGEASTEDETGALPSTGDETGGEPSTGAGEPVVHELTLPMEVAPARSFVLSAEREGDHLIAATELTYGLMPGYPLQVELGSDGGYVLSEGCALNLGEVVWSAISEVEGGAAKFTLEGGALAVELVAEGRRRSC